MGTINRTDKLYVSILCGGSNLYSTEICGLSSIGEIFQRVMKISNIDSGVITIKLRNGTQGWTQQHNVVLKPKPINRYKEKQRSYPTLFDM